MLITEHEINTLLCSNSRLVWNDEKYFIPSWLEVRLCGLPLPSKAQVLQYDSINTEFLHRKSYSKKNRRNK